MDELWPQPDPETWQIRWYHGLGRPYWQYKTGSGEEWPATYFEEEAIAGWFALKDI